MKRLTGKAGSVIACATLMLALGACAPGMKSIPEEDMGLRKATIYSEETVVPDRGEYRSAEPGTGRRLDRSYENSPPLIPHDITGMLPLALTGNICMGCHMPEEALRSGATPIPRSHVMKLATGEDLQGKLDHERYNCMACHVPQVEGMPPVENTFEGGFRNSGDKNGSSLVETLNEGVSAE